MFYIRKYSNGWAIHSDANGCSRLLTEAEVKSLKKEFPQLEDPKVRTVFADQVKSVREKPKRFFFFAPGQMPIRASARCTNVNICSPRCASELGALAFFFQLKRKNPYL